MPILSVKADEYMPKSVIEYEANKLLQEYGTYIGAPISRPPIPVELIAEVYLHLTLDWQEDLPDQPKGTLALIDPNQKLIQINQRLLQRDDRTNFTLAHEIGHYRLHFKPITEQSPNKSEQLFYLCRNNPTHSLNSTRKPQKEYQADYFAGALTMPKKMILEAVAPFNLLQWQSLYKLKDIFEVSISALTARLEQLNCIHIDGRVIYYSEQHKNGQAAFFDQL